jgi:hypothetical protein
LCRHVAQAARRVCQRKIACAYFEQRHTRLIDRLQRCFDFRDFGLRFRKSMTGRGAMVRGPRARFGDGMR